MTKSNVSMTDLTRQLSNIDFPVNKKQLIRYARDNNADETVLREMEALPDQEFRTMRDVTRAMGQTEETGERGAGESNVGSPRGGRQSGSGER